MKKVLLLSVVSFLIILTNCRKKDVSPAMMYVDRTTIDFGTIADNVIAYVDFTTSSADSVYYTITSDSPWLVFEQNAGSLNAFRRMRFGTDISKLSGGAQTALVTISPFIKGKFGDKIILTIKVKYDNSIPTEIEGHILTSDEIWKGKINLNGSVTIPEGKKLTIMPGTKIKVTKNSMMATSINVNGSLIMNGDSINIIELKSNENFNRMNDWAGIQVNGDIEVSYTYFKNASTPLDFISTDMTGGQSKAAIIHHTMFSYCENAIATLSSKFAHSFNNLSFDNLKNEAIGINRLPLGLKLDGINFNNLSSDIVSFGANNSVTVSNSNFNSKTYAGEYNLVVLGASKNNFVLNACFGYSSNNGFGGSTANTFTNNSAAKSKNILAGCGFEANYLSK